MSDNNKFCSYCGISVNEDDVFCNNCGVSLDEKVEPIASAPIMQEQPYTQTTYVQPSAVVTPKPKNYDPVAVTSMGFGIAAVIFGLMPANLDFFIIGASAFAIILGGVSFQKTKKKYMAISGIVLGAIGIALYILSWFGYSLWYLIRSI